MTAERWKKIKALFSSAQDCPEDERSEFLIRACGTDEELKSEVEKLLDSYQDGDSFLQNSAVAEFANIVDGESTVGMGLATSEAPPRFDVGILLNERYEIARLLGRGGMGEVYLASDTRINRNVALKVLHSDLVSSKESLHRFTLEARAVSALNHPHIMTIYEVDSTNDGTLFFVAEYVDGQTLNHLIGSNLDLDTALDIAIQVSSALSAAHEAGITHRDIKPENVMVRRDGYVKVLDFGLAKLAQRPQSPSTSSGSEDPTQALHRTRPGAVMGTAAYMSPEQARGIHVDARTDIWSLGVVLYEMLTEHRPFLGETSADIMVSVLSSEAPPMSSYVHDLPPELEWIVLKALSKSVEGRYQTSKELRADLDKIKKRIQFNESLSRAAGSDSRNDRAKEEEKILSTVEHVIPTAGDVARPTSGGRDESTDPRPFWSSPSFAGVFRQAQTHKVGTSIVALVLVALISSALYLIFTPTAKAQIDSIAVLPFENLSGNSDLAYVSDGFSESLIDRLSQLPQLRVVSRNSSFKFRGSDLDLRDVASQLGVRAIVTGSVAQVGDDLAIRVDIVDAAENRHLTGGQYRRKAGDLSNLQNEIAQMASEQLRLKLTESQAKRLAENGTENSEAFRYYLSGLVELNGPLFVRSKALDYFEQAVTLDPDFAAAHAEIAWVYYSQANNSSDPSEIMPKAKAAAERALAIDPNLAKAHVVQAMVNEYEFDWRGAESEYRRAIELSPNLDFARNNYAFFLSVMGRQTEALAQLDEQGIRDPINRRLMLLHRAIVLTQARRFDDALQTYRDAQAVEPERDIPYFSLGYAYAGKGLYNEAAGYYKKSVASLGGEEKYSQPLVYLAATYAKMPERRSEARAILARIEAMDQYASPALLAAAYSALGDNNKAMELLEQAYIKHDLLLRFVGTGYEYDGLRSDPRFVDLTRRIGLGQ
jgi:serine/threonine protein kinase/Tfp pilus assembly protein PilF